MVAKEHFTKTYGLPRHTIGSGGSGGAIQQLQIAQNYPGVLDALAPSDRFPDAVSIAGGVPTAVCSSAGSGVRRARRASSPPATRAAPTSPPTSEGDHRVRQHRDLFALDQDLRRHPRCERGLRTRAGRPGLRPRRAAPRGALHLAGRQRQHPRHRPGERLRRATTRQRRRAVRAGGARTTVSSPSTSSSTSTRHRRLRHQRRLAARAGAGLDEVLARAYAAGHGHRRHRHRPGQRGARPRGLGGLVDVPIIVHQRLHRPPRRHPRPPAGRSPSATASERPDGSPMIPTCRSGPIPVGDDIASDRSPVVDRRRRECREPVVPCSTVAHHRRAGPGGGGVVGRTPRRGPTGGGGRPVRAGEQRPIVSGPGMFDDGDSLLAGPYPLTAIPDRSPGRPSSATCWPAAWSTSTPRPTAWS